ncbi:MAG: transglycosylase SLT domain-containing protein [Pseudomonadota bacterium]
MLQRLIQNALPKTRATSRLKASPSSARVIIVTSAINSYMAAARNATMILGIVSMVLLALLLAKPEFAHQIRSKLPFASQAVDLAETEVDTAPALYSLMDATVDGSQSESETTKNASLTGEPDSVSDSVSQLSSTSQKQQQFVTYWLSRRYRVAGDAASMLVSTAYETAAETKLDPLLILSVMAIESGLNPFAESPVGAQGLMQVMSKLHKEKFEEMGGIKAALNPAANIKVGALILKEYVRRGGSVEAGLKIYVGAADNETDAGYGARVLAEYRRLQEVAMGKRVAIYSNNPTPSSAQKLRAASDTQTTPTPSLTSGSTPEPVEKAELKSDQVAAL